IKEDIELGRLYVVDCEGLVEGVFLMESGPDETYLEIEGQWLNDEPYYVIHRIASSGKVKGVVNAAVDFALQNTKNVRIDTHEKNLTMQKVLEKIGFKHCGTIYVFAPWEGKSPRMAYHININ
ncbi:MAG: N-acetyltransferase, partial [Clostridia bacterium]|nr:N-acetyltransferase [Clostridia bacterium]